MSSLAALNGRACSHQICPPLNVWPPRLVLTAAATRARYGSRNASPLSCTDGCACGCFLRRLTKHALALFRRLRPCARKLDQNPFLLFGSCLASPVHRLLGILPKLIDL